MAERPAVNASPLIFLSRAGRLSLLKVIADELVIPEPVITEIRKKGPSDVTVQAVAQAVWLTIVEAPPIPPVIQAWDLGSGESSVLAWGATHPGTEVVIDDLSARRCATSLGIPARGTLGLVLTAKQKGSIAEARPVLESLRQSGMYLSDLVSNQALALVGE
ncbi:MAG: DUF3368 domain-containing protein [Acidobacteria bacterium]|nr:DUF3368 domain-containing protein [Acidobacteriota bacterium]MCI0719635.1 DUF3368 domain-containing protein [Acidobacteriota bacterium]